jgi:hypothetical protein
MPDKLGGFGSYDGKESTTNGFLLTNPVLKAIEFSSS